MPLHAGLEADPEGWEERALPGQEFYLGSWSLEEEQEEAVRKGLCAGRAALRLLQGMFCVPSLTATILNKEHKLFGSISEIVLPL